jgi:serine/threonine protein kinase HipA of HipAB toxin-antitoxin module
MAELVDSEEEEEVAILANRAAPAADIRAEAVEVASDRLVAVVVRFQREPRSLVLQTQDMDISS